MKKYIPSLVLTFIEYFNALMAQFTNNCGIENSVVISNQKQNKQ